MNTKNIDLTQYEITRQKYERNKETNEVEAVDFTDTIDPKQLLYDLLRAPGTFKNGTEIVEAVIVARAIRDAGDSIDLNDNDLTIVQKVLNRFIAQEHKPQEGKISLSGPDYEELIMRIYS